LDAKRIVEFIDLYLRHEMVWNDIYGEEISIEPIKPAIVCADGFAMSVQASEGSYSAPRKYLIKQTRYGYTAVEVMLWEQPAPDTWQEYSEHGVEGLYAWVPIELVAELILQHGGLKLSEPWNQHIASE